MAIDQLGVITDTINVIMSSFDLLGDHNDHEVDIRLQFVDDHTYIRLGDPQYDTDLRGVWSAGVITPDTDPAKLAADLVTELVDSIKFSDNTEVNQ